jgi:hypothetical protein
MIIDNRAPRGRLFYSRKLQSIIATAKGVRLEEMYGTPFNTGQSNEKIHMFLDISRLLEGCVQSIHARKGCKRAERFAEWAMGRRVSSYWSEHRKGLYADINELKEAFEAYDRII